MPASPSESMDGSDALETRRIGSGFIRAEWTRHPQYTMREIQHHVEMEAGRTIAALMVHPPE